MDSKSAMKARQAERQAVARIQADYIQALADEIAAPREVAQRPAAWQIVVRGQDPEKVALVVLWSVMRHRPQDSEHPPSVATVAHDIAMQLGAADMADALLDARSPDLRKRMIDAGIGLLGQAVNVGLIQPFTGSVAAKRDKGQARRILLTDDAACHLAEYARRCMTLGLAWEMFPLDEPPDPQLDPVRVRRNWRGMIEPPPLPPAFIDACEHIRRTPWRVNQFVLRCMVANLDDEHARYLFRDLQRPGWHSDAKRKDRVIALEVARDIGAKPFYLDVQCDYRGRIYHGGALRFNGADKAMRPLLEFAEGETVTAEGSQYLAAYVASQWGQKGNLAELRQWTDRNTALLLATARDPDRNDAWFRELDDDERWGALAAADAWRRYMTGQPVHLPCSWDAVTSGLQVYALLMRDRGLAEKVALLEGTVGNYYEEVARQSGGETRAAAKAVAMPLFYGAKPRTSAEALAEMEGGRNWQNFRERADTLRAKAEELAPAFVKVRDWLQRDVAPIFSKLRLPIFWETPVGFGVVQDNHNIPKREIKTTVEVWEMADGGRRKVSRPIKLILREPSRGLDKGKQSSSIAANLVHSLDASWLVQTVNHAADYGVRSFGTVHDCFAVHCNRVPILLQSNKDALVDVFGPDTLASLHAQWEEQTGAEIPPPPVHAAELPPDWLNGRRALEPG